MANKYANKRHSMELSAQAAKGEGKHPYGKGAAHLSAERLVEKGRKWHGGQTYKEVALQLQEQANFRGSKGEAGEKFAEAAKLARRKGRKAGEYKTKPREAESWA